MDAVAIAILSVTTVASVAFVGVKQLLDQVPDVIDSAGRARDSWQRLKQPELPPPADDEEPPAAT
ncbi:putative protein OS=Streptomyces microflavus OX=1919 GN=Smic_60950 PE=4 SV=1 [Streptomyces microflavus]